MHLLPIRLLCLLLLAAGLSACATITRGSSDVLIVNSDPSGAKVTTSTGLSGTTPATFKANRRGGFVVKIEKQGFETVEIQISSKIHGAGGTALAGNIIFGGLIGAAVDAGTGAAFDLVPNPVMAKLVPVVTAPPPPAPAPSASASSPAPAATDDASQRAAASMLHLAVTDLRTYITSGYLLADFTIANANSFAVSKLDIECVQNGAPLRSAPNEVLKHAIDAAGSHRYTGVSFGEGHSNATLTDCRVWRMDMPVIELAN